MKYNEYKYLVTSKKYHVSVTEISTMMYDSTSNH